MSGSLQSPYGYWQSPITSELISTQAISLQDVLLDGEDTYWIEGRPQDRESGRYVVVKFVANCKTQDVLPPEFNARTRVHEYGGGAVLIDGGTTYFTHFADQRLYRSAAIGAAPAAMTPAYEVEYGPPDDRKKANDVVRYADPVLDHRRRRILCVLEDHRPALGSTLSEDVTKVANCLAAVNLDSVGDPIVLVSGRDFYAAPRVSPDGNQLAWLCWDHPNMPWVAAELWVASIGPHGLTDARRIAGGADESVFQPEWSPGGQLYFVSDRSGWWNLYRLEANGSALNVCPREAEFGQPQWNFGMSTYAFLSDQRAVCTYTEKGTGKVLLLDLATLATTELALPYTEFSSVRASGGRVALRAGSATVPASIVLVNPDTAHVTVARRATEVGDQQVPGKPESKLSDYFTTSQPIEFPTADGNRSFGFYYPPSNPDYTPPEGELPPLVVKCHGGPTAAASSSLDLRIQFWTSRGAAVIDVDYGGSTGYGREFRNRLQSRWGVVDVEDCAAAVRYLSSRRMVDPDRVVITGGSAGGYTTLACVTYDDAKIRGLFRAGGSHYGVSDPAALARDTHKFESRYLDWLIAPYNDPDPVAQARNRARYEERSPVAHADRLASSVTFFQGTEDKIVPPSQTERMVTALSKKGLTVQYLLFAGEQHGFRQARHIKWALDAELGFYQALAFAKRPATAAMRNIRAESTLAAAPEIAAVFFDLGDTLGKATIAGSPSRLVQFAVFPEAKAVLESLKSRPLKLGVISNTGLQSGAEINRILKPTGVLDYFDAALVVYSSEVGVTKAFPEMFELAAERAGLAAEPLRCLFVGEDDQERLVAQSAGWTVCAAPSLVDALLPIPAPSLSPAGTVGSSSGKPASHDRIQ